MTKKKLLLISATALITEVILWLLQSGDWCYDNDFCRSLWDQMNVLGEILFVFIPVILLTALLYKLPEEVFQYWWRFARWFVLVIVIVTLLINLQ